MRKKSGKANEWKISKETPLENAAWESYYKKSGICLDETEFDVLRKTLLEPLPVGIRINRLHPFFDTLNAVCEKLSKKEGSEQCKEVSFLDHAWQWESLDRRLVKKTEGLRHLKHWLMHCEVTGALTRQEVVSMVPPVALDVQPGHTILDLCAAPGSKTTQILESMAGQGLLIANDVDWKRANMLAHQVNRMCSPCVVTVNLDACFFPNQMKFDRILCDVPCTADGTLRKTPEIWRTWKESEGNVLHPRQLQILLKGLQLLKVGGRLVYSTCSLNPREDEDVINAALDKLGGEVELVNVFESIKGFNARKGMIRTPLDDERNIAFSRRFLPHLMNTGGFFVACFTRKIVSQSDSLATNKKKKVDEDGSSDKSQVKFIEEDMWDSLSSFYGLEKLQRDQFVVPKGQEKRIVFVSQEVSEFARSASEGMRLVSVGVRAFCLHADNVWNSACSLRITQEGASALWGSMKKRVVIVPLRELFIPLLQKRELALPDTNLVDCKGWKETSDEPGGCVIVSDELEIPLACMVFARSIQVFTDKTYCLSLLEVLLRKDSPNW